jgi:predicted Zn finger-like uncharacterized protein
MKTQCPNCKSKFNVNETNIGKQAKCTKCAKLFIIEPFVETPAATLTAEHAETAEKNNKISSASAEVKSDTPFVKNAAPAPVETPAKIAEPADNRTAKHPLASSGQAAETVEEKPKIISANSAVSAVESVSRTALSKTVFVYCWMAVRVIAGILGALGLVLAIQKGAKSTLIATFAAADVFLVCSAAIELMLFYKMWAAIKDSQVSISPGRAVGFLFIPVFNIYWALLMLTGFTEDYNSFVIRRSIRAGRLSMTLFLIYAVLFMSAAMFVTIPMICVFPVIGLISRAFEGYPLASWVLVSIAAAAGIGHFITYILVAIKTCNAINALPGKQA